MKLNAILWGGLAAGALALLDAFVFFGVRSAFGIGLPIALIARRLICSRS